MRLVCLKVRELRECFVAARFVIMEALLTFWDCRWKKFVSDLLAKDHDNGLAVQEC